MRKLSLSSVLLALIAGLAFASTPVWIAKPYQQWDQKDLQEILEHSPWIKTTTIIASWGRSSMEEENPNPSEGQRPQGQPRLPGSSDNPAGQAPQGNMGQQPEGSMEQNVTYIVRWNSAQTIREAMAREALLQGKATEAQVAQYVDKQPPTYDIWVYGRDMTPFTKETDASLQSKTFLQIKPSKERVSPAKVEILKTPDGKGITGVLFSFPKQDANGKAVLAPHAKQAHFQCKTKLANVSVNFDLRKMVGKSGQEL